MAPKLEAVVMKEPTEVPPERKAPTVPTKQKYVTISSTVPATTSEPSTVMATPDIELITLDSTDECEGWVSAIVIPETTPPIKIKKKFLAALPQFSGEEGEDPWGFLNRFMWVCGKPKRQAEVQEEIFRLATFPYCLSGEASRWFKGIPLGSITTWAELKTTFLRQYANQREFEMSREEYLNWAIARAKWATSNLGMDPLQVEEMPTQDAKEGTTKQAREQHDEVTTQHTQCGAWPRLRYLKARWRMTRSLRKNGTML